MDCRLAAEEVGVVVGETITLPNGTSHPFADCVIEPGSTLSFPYVEATHMDPAALPVPDAPPAEAPVSEAAPVAPEAPAAPATTAHTAVPASPEVSPIDIGKLGGDNPVAVVALVGIAALTGGAAWKFWTKKSEMAHDLKVKELELKSQPSTSPPSCIAKHTDLDAKLTALEGKVASVEKKTSSFSSSTSSVDDLEERIEKLEKAAKAAKKAGGK